MQKKQRQVSARINKQLWVGTLTRAHAMGIDRAAEEDKVSLLAQAIKAQAEYMYARSDRKELLAQYLPDTDMPRDE